MISEKTQSKAVLVMFDRNRSMGGTCNDFIHYIIYDLSLSISDSAVV